MLVLVDSVSIPGIPKSLLAKATEELDTKMEELAEELATESVAGRKCDAVLFERKTKVGPRMAQKWAKQLKEDPSWKIYEKQTNQSNRKSLQLQEEHKHHLIDFLR
ncbi:hypothetical protein G6F56_005194 [Rhizopus delemar]|nr:hypothetical protein G6F56_005194 [Rhizopus delemar]